MNGVLGTPDLAKNAAKFDQEKHLKSLYDSRLVMNLFQRTILDFSKIEQAG
ncbi:hypothetical protein O9992_02170 [Vibrio lentus]|nr:hypothetical protein [Vibrio lentus]